MEKEKGNKKEARKERRKQARGRYEEGKEFLYEV